MKNRLPIPQFYRSYCKKSKTFFSNLLIFIFIGKACTGTKCVHFVTVLKSEMFHSLRYKDYILRSCWRETSEAIPSINYIGRQLDVSYIGRQMYGEISIYQIRETSSGQHIVPKSTFTVHDHFLWRERAQYWKRNWVLVSSLYLDTW